VTRIDPTTMTTDDIDAEIEHLQGYFDDCADIGQGISTKDSVRMRRLSAERDARTTAVAA
jgi:hypothetical protein